MAWQTEFEEREYMCIFLVQVLWMFAIYSYLAAVIHYQCWNHLITLQCRSHSRRNHGWLSSNNLLSVYCVCVHVCSSMVHTG